MTQSPDITITITGTQWAPSWVDLEQVIKGCTGRQLVMSRINRTDGGCCYRDPGEYVVGMIDTENGHQTVQVLLTVKGCPVHTTPVGAEA